MPDTATKMSNHDRVIFLRERINSLSRQIEAEGLEEDYERYLAGLQNGSIKPKAIADAEWEVMLPGQRKKDFLAYYHARRCEWLELMKEGKPHGSRKRFIEWLQNPWVITRIAEAFTLVEGAVFILHSVQGMGFSLLPNEGTQADKPRLIPPDIASGLPMSAKDYLETLHTQGAGLQPLEDDQIDQLQRTYRGDRELTEEESRQFASVRASMDAGDDHIQFIATQLISALPEELKQKIANIPVGIVPIDAPNAMAQSPTGDPLIIIQRGLHSLCFNVASAWLASQLMPGSPAERDRTTATLYAFEIAMFAIKRNPKWLPKQFLQLESKTRQSIVGGMVWNAMVFTLGHEYGHILLGHLEGALTKKASGLAEAEVFVRSPEQEFKADEVGFRFAVLWSRTTHKADLPGLLGIALSLHVGRLLQAFQAQGGESGSAEIAERYARFKQWTRDEKVPEEPLVDDLERFVSLTIDTGTAYLRETAS